MAKTFEIIGRVTYEFGGTVKAGSEEDAKTIFKSIISSNSNSHDLEGPVFLVTFPKLTEENTEILEVKETAGDEKKPETPIEPTTEPVAEA